MGHNKEAILTYLKSYLSDPALEVIDGLDDAVFERATQSMRVIHATLPELVQMYWTVGKKGPILRGGGSLIDTTALEGRQLAIRRTIIFSHLFKPLFGKQPDSQELAQMFAGDGRKKGLILRSTVPQVMKLREHLGPGMVLLELITIDQAMMHECLTDETKPLPTEHPSVRFARLLNEAFDFRRNWSGDL